jgi:hypothetical protein
MRPRQLQQRHGPRQLQLQAEMTIHGYGTPMAVGLHIYDDDYTANSWKIKRTDQPTGNSTDMIAVARDTSTTSGVGNNGSYCGNGNKHKDGRPNKGTDINGVNGLSMAQLLPRHHPHSKTDRRVLAPSPRRSHSPSSLSSTNHSRLHSNHHQQGQHQRVLSSEESFALMNERFNKRVFVRALRLASKEKPASSLPSSLYSSSSSRGDQSDSQAASAAVVESPSLPSISISPTPLPLPVSTMVLNETKNNTNMRTVSDGYQRVVTSDELFATESQLQLSATFGKRMKAAVSWMRTHNNSNAISINSNVHEPHTVGSKRTRHHDHDTSANVGDPPLDEIDSDNRSPSSSLGSLPSGSDSSGRSIHLGHRTLADPRPIAMRDTSSPSAALSLGHEVDLSLGKLMRMVWKVSKEINEKCANRNTPIVCDDPNNDGDVEQLPLVFNSSLSLPPSPSSTSMASPIVTTLSLKRANGGSACSICNQRHWKCNFERPCDRCIKNGSVDQCCDRISPMKTKTTTVVRTTTMNTSASPPSPSSREPSSLVTTPNASSPSRTSSSLSSPVVDLVTPGDVLQQRATTPSPSMASSHSPSKTLANPSTLRVSPSPTRGNGCSESKNEMGLPKAPILMTPADFNELDTSSDDEDDYKKIHGPLPSSTDIWNDIYRRVMQAQYRCNNYQLPLWSITRRCWQQIVDASTTKLLDKVLIQSVIPSPPSPPPLFVTAPLEPLPIETSATLIPPSTTVASLVATTGTDVSLTPIIYPAPIHYKYPTAARTRIFMTSDQQMKAMEAYHRGKKAEWEANRSSISSPSTKRLRGSPNKKKSTSSSLSSMASSSLASSWSQSVLASKKEANLFRSISVITGRSTSSSLTSSTVSKKRKEATDATISPSSINNWEKRPRTAKSASTSPITETNDDSDDDDDDGEVNDAKSDSSSSPSSSTRPETHDKGYDEYYDTHTHTHHASTLSPLRSSQTSMTTTMTPLVASPIATRWLRQQKRREHKEACYLNTNYLTTIKQKGKLQKMKTLEGVPYEPSHKWIRKQVSMMTSTFLIAIVSPLCCVSLCLDV